MTTTIDVATAKTPLSELVNLVLNGAEVILSNGEKPLVRLVPVAPVADKRMAGLHLGAIITTDDFDDPLPDEFWEGQP